MKFFRRNEPDPRVAELQVGRHSCIAGRFVWQSYYCQQVELENANQFAKEASERVEAAIREREQNDDALRRVDTGLCVSAGQLSVFGTLIWCCETSTARFRGPSPPSPTALAPCFQARRRLLSDHSRQLAEARQAASASRDHACALLEDKSRLQAELIQHLQVLTSQAVGCWVVCCVCCCILSCFLLVRSNYGPWLASCEALRQRASLVMTPD